MRSLKQIGNLGEELAESYLKKQGWKILSRNYSAHGGEIDIIGYRWGVLVYFEVKSRSNDSFGSPSDAVDSEKLRKIKSAARDFKNLYCRKQKVPVSTIFGNVKEKRIRRERIDVVEVYFRPDYSLHRINHIKDWGSRL